MGAELTLLETDSGALVDEFETLDEALAAIRHMLKANGSGYVRGLSLVRLGAPGGVEEIASGAALQARAEAG